MQDILNRSQSENEDMSSRVRVLLAGSALTTKAGVRIERRDTIEQVDYTAVGEFILGTTLLHFRFSCLFLLPVLVKCKPYKQLTSIYLEQSEQLDDAGCWDHFP